MLPLGTDAFLLVHDPIRGPLFYSSNTTTANDFDICFNLLARYQFEIVGVAGYPAAHASGRGGRRREVDDLLAVDVPAVSACGKL
jgi:hypothetical protein